MANGPGGNGLFGSFGHDGSDSGQNHNNQRHDNPLHQEAVGDAYPHTNVIMHRIDMVPLQPTPDSVARDQSGQVYFRNEGDPRSPGQPIYLEDPWAPSKLVDNWARSGFSPNVAHDLENWFRYKLNKDVQETYHGDPSKASESLAAITATLQNQLDRLKSDDRYVWNMAQDQLNQKMAISEAQEAAAAQKAGKFFEPTPFRDVTFQARFNEKTGEVAIYDGNTTGKYGTAIKLNVVGVPDLRRSNQQVGDRNNQVQQPQQQGSEQQQWTAAFQREVQRQQQQMDQQQAQQQQSEQQAQQQQLEQQQQAQQQPSGHPQRIHFSQRDRANNGVLPDAEDNSLYQPVVTADGRHLFKKNAPGGMDPLHNPDYYLYDQNKRFLAKMTWFRPGDKGPDGHYE